MRSIARDGFEGKVSASESHLSGKDKAYIGVQPHPLAKPLCSHIQKTFYLVSSCSFIPGSSTPSYTKLPQLIRSFPISSKVEPSTAKSQSHGLTDKLWGPVTSTRQNLHLICNPQSRVQSKASPNITTQHRAGWFSMCPCPP